MLSGDYSSTRLTESSPKASGGKASLTTVTSTAPARNGGLVSSLLSVSKGSAARGQEKLCFPHACTHADAPYLHGTFKIKVYFFYKLQMFSIGTSPVVKIPPRNAEDMGLITDGGAKIPQATGQLSPRHNRRGLHAARKTQHRPTKK